MRTINSVIFDLDDTLYPERAFAFSGFAAVAEALPDIFSDPVEATARMVQLFDTEHRGRVFNSVLSERGVEPEEQLVNRMIEAYRTHRPRITLHLDAEGVLTRLAGDCKLGLITDGPAIMQSNKIAALGLRPCFDEIILTDELGEGCAKPHPRAFELMSKRLAVDHARCIYIADNPAKDFLAPNALGWKTVQITRKDGIYRSELPPEPGLPDHVIDTLDALDALLRS